MKVRQHIPGFVDNDPVITEVDSATQLLALPFVQNWKHGPPFLSDKGFHRFSVHRNYWGNTEQDPKTQQIHLLLAEFDQGYQWWVVANLTGSDSLDVLRDLPDWEAKEKPKTDPGCAG